MISASKVLRAGVLAASIALSLAPAVASAASRDQEIVFYFADDSYTHHVGTVIYTCAGGVQRSGVETPYSQVMISTPCKPDHPELPGPELPYN